MTTEIQHQDWSKFMDCLSRDLADWQTTVQVLSDDTGAQILSDGLPFNGVTFDGKSGVETIEVSVGSGGDNHQTHTIVAPTKVAFERSGLGPAGTLDIEDTTGTKTLITFVQPIQVLVEYASAEILTVG